MGILLGFGSTAFFALQQALIRVGMHSRPRDDGLFMSVLLNTVLLGPIMVAISSPAWSWSGVVGFVVAGLFTTWAGRWAGFKAIRRIGPARTSAFLMSGPVFAATVGWVILGEAIHPMDLLGAVVITVGLVILIVSRAAADSLVVAEEATRAQESSGGSVRPPIRLRRSHASVHGFVYGIVGAIFFGVGFVVRKWALLRYSSAVAGAFFGAVAALAAILITTAHRRDLARLADDNVRDVPWPFVLAGIASSLGLVMQFGALYFLPAWIVSVFQGSQGLWMLVWSPLLLGQEERLTGQVVTAILVVAAGAGIIAMRP